MYEGQMKCTETNRGMIDTSQYRSSYNCIRSRVETDGSHDSIDGTKGTSALRLFDN